MKGLLLLLSVALTSVCLGQVKKTIIIKDSLSSEGLVATTVKAGNTTVITDSNGRASFSWMPGTIIILSRTGYETRSILPADSAAELSVLLVPAEKELNEVIVSSSRTDTRIENLPTKVEVLGTEEVEEETGIKPSNIASLLGDVAGIQTQQTSAVSGNTELRIQGLPGKYTQLLRDGMPLFGDFAGGFSIMQIPPLDLKQIEIIKGASSTLYGGGAIAGLINVISKSPKLHQFEKTLLLNYSSLSEANANLYLSNRNEKAGFTFFTGYTHQNAKDVNSDGFSDVPRLKSYFIHPRFFYYPDTKNTIAIGYHGTFEDRYGGDMEVVEGKGTGLHQFFLQNKLDRHTIDLQWEDRITNTHKFTLKAIGSSFDRDIATNNVNFNGKQFSYYTEASYVIKSQHDDVVFGANFNGEHFTAEQPNNTQLQDFTYRTVGLFVQNDWRMLPRFTLETGLRSDFHNVYGTFILPRLSLLYKISDAFTTRLGGGFGYKIPTVFDSEVDEREYPLIIPISGAKAERSQGANWDVNFHKRIGETDLTINQSFYITHIDDPVLTLRNNNNQIYFQNATTKGLLTKGIETYVQVKIDELELYLGYTLTDARKQYDATQPHLELSAKDKFASVLGYDFSEHFKAGIEAAYTGPQYLDNGTQTPSYWFTAAMVRYDWPHVAVVLNAENALDYRQSKIEPIVTSPISNPVFKQLWAPIDGRVVNLSVRFKF